MDPLTAKQTLDAASGALGFVRSYFDAICLPPVAAYGEHLAQRVSHWSAENLKRLVEASQRTVPADAGLYAHPRIVHEVFRHGQWVDDHEVQDWWGGLLASSCTEDGKDDSNLLFTGILGRMTSMQAKLLDHVCRKATKRDINGFCSVNTTLHLSLDQITGICQSDEIHRIDREVDHMRSMSLLSFNAGLDVHGDSHDLTPTDLALAFHVRCQGSRLSPVEFFADEIPTPAAETPSAGDATKLPKNCVSNAR